MIFDKLIGHIGGLSLAPFTGLPAPAVSGPPLTAGGRVSPTAGAPFTGLLAVRLEPPRRLKPNPEKPRERGSRPARDPTHPPSTAGRDRWRGKPRERG